MISIDYLSVLRRRSAIPEFSERPDAESGHKCRHYTIFSFMIKLFYDKSMSFLQEKKEER